MATYRYSSLNAARILARLAGIHASIVAEIDADFCAGNAFTCGLWTFRPVILGRRPMVDITRENDQ